jgi:FAD binding domain
MRAKSINVIVVGQGAAGLAATLSAAEEASGPAVQVTLLEKAEEDEAGGNTRWTPAYMRMAAVDRVEPNFVRDMLAATNGLGDESYFARLAHAAPATVRGSPRTASNSTSPTITWQKGRRVFSPSAAGHRSIASSSVRRRPPACRSAMAPLRKSC